MKIDFEEKFTQLQQELAGSQKRISLNSALKVFYGITSDHYLRISFLSTAEPPKIESTKEMRVFQGMESQGNYWTCFDLLDEAIRSVFFVFCNSLISSVENADNYAEAINALKNRFNAWKNLFKSKGRMSLESYQGLFGELYFLRVYLNNLFDIDACVDAWVGPEGYSKDFSIENSWYETKTIGANKDSVKISSLAQLESDVPGHLVVIRAEKMSEMYENEFCNIKKLYKDIITRLSNDEMKEKFINKTLKYGYVFEDDQYKYKYEVKGMDLYLVDDRFPKLTKKTINCEAITNISYEIMIALIEEFMEAMPDGH